MTETLEPGITFNRQFTVTKPMTMPTLGHRILDSWILIGELGDTCMAAIEPYLVEGEVTVGGMFDVRFLAPVRTGQVVDCSVTLNEVSGRRLVFDVEARSVNDLVAVGSHVRVRLTP